MGKTHIGRLITLSFIVLLGAGLRFYGIARESLWMDEATTVRCAHRWFRAAIYELFGASRATEASELKSRTA
jgi:hypothetical protein